jgi:4a-hydroxytetrahydrobiopterin dehydratase
MSDRLDDQAINDALTRLPGWSRAGDVLEKHYTTASFADAVTLLTRIAFEAEAADHHPDLWLEYRRLTVRYWTHTAGGITTKDVDGAVAAERLAQPFITPAR